MNFYGVLLVFMIISRSELPFWNVWNVVEDPPFLETPTEFPSQLFLEEKVD